MWVEGAEARKMWVAGAEEPEEPGSRLPGEPGLRLSD
jgi:hypothetical protein